MNMNNHLITLSKLYHTGRINYFQYMSAYNSFIFKSKKHQKDQQHKLSQQLELDKLQETQKNHKPQPKIISQKPKLSDTDILKEQKEFITSLKGLTTEEIMNKINSGKVIKRFGSEHNHSETVVLLEGYIVRKSLEQTGFGNYLFWNEIKSLKTLFPFKHFPKLILYDARRLIIYMTYCGPLVSPKNLPSNWKDQLEDIRKILKATNVSSNDMIARNTCVLDGTLHIIDFGLNTVFRSDIDVTVDKFFNRLLQIEIASKVNKK